VPLSAAAVSHPQALSVSVRMSRWIKDCRKRRFAIPVATGRTAVSSSATIRTQATPSRPPRQARRSRRKGRQTRSPVSRQSGAGGSRGCDRHPGNPGCQRGGSARPTRAWGAARGLVAPAPVPAIPVGRHLGDPGIAPGPGPGATLRAATALACRDARQAVDRPPRSMALRREDHCESWTSPGPGSSAASVPFDPIPIGSRPGIPASATRRPCGHLRDAAPDRVPSFPSS
jgi:hypothetical protein